MVKFWRTRKPRHWHKKLRWDRQTWEVETASETAPLKMTPQPTSLSILIICWANCNDPCKSSNFYANAWNFLQFWQYHQYIQLSYFDVETILLKWGGNWRETRGCPSHWKTSWNRYSSRHAVIIRWCHKWHLDNGSVNLLLGICRQAYGYNILYTE